MACMNEELLGLRRELDKKEAILREMVEEKRGAMIAAVHEDEWGDFQALFESQDVVDAVKGNDRMCAFWTDQLR